MQVNTKYCTQCTYIPDVKMSDDIISQCDCVDQRDFVVVAHDGAHLWPILGALDLQLLYEVGQHDNGRHIVVPYHTPEVSHSLRQGTLGGDELLGTVKTLRDVKKNLFILVTK